MASTEGNTQTYKMTSLDTDINQHFQDAIDVIQQHSNNSYYDSEYRHYETIGSQHPSLECQICCLVKHPSDVPASGYDWNDTTASWPPVIPDVSLPHPVPNESHDFYSILPTQRSSKGRKKLRLYEYLHEALNDPNMGDSIQWTDSGSGTFHFISKNKEKLAECWGQRKGNRKTMTYQKMARALRNYSRTGEIIKVRRKLTYQFNPDILHRLGSTQVALHLPCHPNPAQEGNHAQQQQSQAEQSYFSSAAVDWHSWYGQYQLQEDYDLASSFTSHSTAKL
ncbi:transcription factor Spi-C isoform X2 [Echeneis naucrates]|uniref:transcription factor Spi-C isoform X2 n=1 Tax=Echeneis naucrates TaxID=173247 RepID=UPI001113C622|nr:transcription factor Spi-C-like isoform X2 [Echeneis naucrates]